MSSAKKRRQETSIGARPPAEEIVRQARETAEPENYFIGLADASLPLSGNILMFCTRDLTPLPCAASHQRHMLIFNLETAAAMMVDGLMLRLSPGQAMLMFPFQSHRFLIQHVKRMTWLYITFDLPENDRLEYLRNRTVDVAPELWPIIRDLMTEYRMADSGRGAANAVAPLLSYLLVRLLRGCREPMRERWEPYLPLPAHRIVQRASQYMLSHMGDAFSVGKVATTLAVSPAHLRRCFRRVLGISVRVHLQRTRMCAACSLLSRTEANITEIAERCGFGSLYAFSRAFKREIGMPPTRYREHLWKDRNVARPRRRSASPQ